MEGELAAAIIARDSGACCSWVWRCNKSSSNGTDVTVSCAEGDEDMAYQGALDTEVTN